MDLGTLGVQIKWILEHWGYRSNGSWNIGCTGKMDLRTLGVQIKWILEHWGYRSNGLGVQIKWILEQHLRALGYG